MNELKVVTNETKTLAEVTDYKAKAIEYLNAMGSTLSNKDKTLFIELAQSYGLNPFKREIYTVGYKDSFNILTGYEVYIKRAERTAKLDGWETIEEGSGESLKVTVVIYRKDWSKPFKHTVYYREVCQKNKDGTPNKFWKKMPVFMTKKVAIAQGFRLCFPDEFGGMPYTVDEMPEGEEIPIGEVYVNEQPEQVRKVADVFRGEVVKISDPAPQVEVTQVTSVLFTPEQAKELGNIVNAVKGDNPVFSDKEKARYREMLKKGQFTNALEESKKILQERLLTLDIPVTDNGNDAIN